MINRDMQLRLRIKITKDVFLKQKLRIRSLLQTINKTGYHKEIYVSKNSKKIVVLWIRTDILLIKQYKKLAYLKKDISWF